MDQPTQGKPVCKLKSFCKVPGRSNLFVFELPKTAHSVREVLSLYFNLHLDLNSNLYLNVHLSWYFDSHLNFDLNCDLNLYLNLDLNFPLNLYLRLSLKLDLNLDVNPKEAEWWFPEPHFSAHRVMLCAVGESKSRRNSRKSRYEVSRIGRM